MHTPPSSSSSRCNKCIDRQQGGNGNVNEEKLAQLIYECFFNSSVSFSGATHIFADCCRIFTRIGYVCSKLD